MKEDFINHISGIEFFKKLTIEFNGDEKRAAEEQKKRIENVKSVNVIVIEDESEFNKKIEEISKKNKKNFSGDPRELKGGYNHDDHTIYSKMDLGIIGHELLHSETRGREGISENAKRILENSYLRQGFLNIFSDKYDDYFSDVAEMLPGKKALDLDLKEANIKKYGEKFTNKHYEKIMEEYEKYIKGEKSLLSPMSAEFIKRIKKENLGDVLDKIASNENQDKIVAV